MTGRGRKAGWFENLARPLVLKMGGAWTWVCWHDGLVGDLLPPGSSRDPWSAAQCLARKHAEVYHPATTGEVL